MSNSASLQSVSPLTAFPLSTPSTGFRPDLSTAGAMDRTMSGAYETDVNRTLPVAPLAVERRIADGTLWPQATVLPLDRLGSLVIERPLHPAVCSGLPGWRASGRLVGRGWPARWPARPLGRVDIEILPWSATTTGLRLARRSPIPTYWSTRRVRRYWALAHAAADGLAGV